MEEVKSILDFIEKYAASLTLIVTIIGSFFLFFKWIIDKNSENSKQKEKIKNEILKLLPQIYEEKEYLMLNYSRINRGVSEIDNSMEKFNTLEIEIESKFLTYLPNLKNKYKSFSEYQLNWEHNGGSSSVNPREDIKKMKKVYEELIKLVKKEKIEG